MIGIAGCADDHQLVRMFRAYGDEETKALHDMQRCLEDARKWMVYRSLKMNDVQYN